MSRTPDVRQPAVNQRQHILSSILVKEPPFTVHRDVDRRGVSEYATLPFIVVMQGTRLRPPAASCQPGMAVNLERRFQAQPPCTFRVLCGGDDASLLYDLQVV